MLLFLIFNLKSMKKYKLLKHIDNQDWNEIEIWKEFELNKDFFQFNDWWRCSIDFLIRKWYIEEVKEEVKPTYRKVYVSDISTENALEDKHDVILLTELPWNPDYKYICVDKWNEEEFLDWEEYYTNKRKIIAEIPTQKTITIKAKVDWVEKEFEVDEEKFYNLIK